MEQEKVQVIQIQMTEANQYFQLSHQQVAEVGVTMVEPVNQGAQAAEEEILTSQEAQVTPHQLHPLKVIMVEQVQVEWPQVVHVLLVMVVLVVEVLALQAVVLQLHEVVMVVLVLLVRWIVLMAC